MQEQDAILLLTKQFSGELTEAETIELNGWLRRSAENERVAAELRQVWVAYAHYTPDFSPDLETDFQKVQARIRAAPTPRMRVVPLRRRLLQAAAVLAFLATATWTYRTFYNPAVAIITATAQDQSKRQVDLPDGSRVWLRQGSTLDFPPVFNGSERRVKLHGEAYFDVAHRDGQPFRVELSNGDRVEVVGTQFDVRQSTQENSVLVRSGKVHFQSIHQPKPLTLGPGEKAIHDLSKNTTHEARVATFNELAWQTGGLEFVKTPLATVVADLEQFYQVKIVLRNAALHQCLHTAPLTSQPLDRVLQTLSLTYQLRVLHTTTGQYELVGGICQ